jgi:hypothetical protein
MAGLERIRTRRYLSALWSTWGWLRLLENRVRQPETLFRRPEEVRSRLRREFSEFQRESFGVLYLDQLIAFDIVPQVTHSSS